MNGGGWVGKNDVGIWMISAITGQPYWGGRAADTPQKKKISFKKNSFPSFALNLGEIFKR